MLVASVSPLQAQQPERRSGCHGDLSQRHQQLGKLGRRARLLGRHDLVQHRQCAGRLVRRGHLPRRHAAVNDHPVIAQNIYRLKDGRFSQIGMSWLKHGWLSTNSSDSACGSCASPPRRRRPARHRLHRHLWLGPERRQRQPGHLPRRRQLPARTALGGECDHRRLPDALHQHRPSRLRSTSASRCSRPTIDPALNAGASYWVEGQYIAADDGFAGNAFNNASYRPRHGRRQLLSTSRSPARRSARRARIQAWVVADPDRRARQRRHPGSSSARALRSGAQGHQPRRPAPGTTSTRSAT